jgi:hypothetical protein
MNIDKITVENFLYIINIIIQYLISPPAPFDQWIEIIKIIFISISLLLLLFIIFFISKTSWLRSRYLEGITEFLTYKPFGAGKIVKQWEKIKRRLETGLEAERKLIIIEADSIFNNVLERMGYIDENFELRIKRLTPEILPNIEEILEAHKICNNIIYDPDYRLNLDQTKRIILIYEKALIDLQIL